MARRIRSTAFFLVRQTLGPAARKRPRRDRSKAGLSCRRARNAPFAISSLRCGQPCQPAIELSQKQPRRHKPCHGHLSDQSGTAPGPPGVDAGAGGQAGPAPERGWMRWTPETADPRSVDRWFQADGPLGEIPRGDKCCSLSHRAAWEKLLASGAAYAVVLEDDVVLRDGAAFALNDSNWIPPGRRSYQAGALRPARPERAAVGFRAMSARASASPACGRATPAPRPISCRAARRELLLAIPASTCRWIIFCSIPTIRRSLPGCSPGNCCRSSRGSRTSWATNPISKAGAWACANSASPM